MPDNPFFGGSAIGPTVGQQNFSWASVANTLVSTVGDEVMARIR